jgi:hypothetical protein
MAVGSRANPDVGVSRWNRELADAREHLGIAHGFAVRAIIGKALARSAAPDAGLLVGHIGQTGAFGSLDRIDDRADLGIAAVV